MYNVFNNIDFSGPLRHIRDDLGLKQVNVYFLTRRKGVKDQVEQVIPTPGIKQIGEQEVLDSGGTVSVGDVILRSISLNKYPESSLSTATDNKDIKRYWVLKGPTFSAKAYTTRSIKIGRIFAEVVISRYKSINTEELEALGV